MSRYVPNPALDEWKRRRDAARAHGQPPADVQVDPDDGWVWVHGDGCMTEALPGTPAYPFCAHSVRAGFIGRRGDGYVTTGLPERPTDLIDPSTPLEDAIDEAS